MPQFVPVHPPRNPDECPEWLYEAIKRLNRAAHTSVDNFAAIIRGEVPDGSGDSLSVDLSQYFFLPGRPSGQVAFGDTNASGILTLSSTSSGTKGKIYLGSAHTSAYDEANDRLGLATASPAARVHIIGIPGTNIQASADVLQQWGLYNDSGTPPATATAALLAIDDSNSYTARNSVGTFTIRCSLSSTIASGQSSITLVFRSKKTASLSALAAGTIGVYDNAGVAWTKSYASLEASFTTSWVTYTIILTGNEAGISNDVTKANQLYINYSSGANEANYWAITYVSFPVASGGDALVVQASSVQGDNLTEWQDSSSNIMSYVDPQGTLVLGNASVGPNLKKLVIQNSASQSVDAVQVTSPDAGTTDLTINQRNVVASGRIKALSGVLLTDDNATIASARKAGFDTSLVAQGATRVFQFTDRDGAVATSANVVCDDEASGGNPLTYGGDLVLA